MISSGDNSPRSSAQQSANAPGKQLIAMGRWVSIYNEVHGLIRRSILPRYGKPVTGDKAQILLEPLLRQITGRQELNTLILLLAPSSKQNFHRKLHCFDRDTFKHLGSTCITNHELELMQQYEMLIKYEMVFTDEYLPIKSLACDSSIISQLVQSRRTASLVEEEPETKPKIKSLRQPKIPVRMRASDVKRIEKKQNYVDGASGEPVWKI